MTKPFKGVVNLDIRDSKPDWEPYLQPTAPEGAPNVLFIVWDDVGFAAMEPWGGLIETPTMNRLGQRRSHLHQHAYHSPVLADTCLFDNRAQSYQQWYGLYFRGGHRLSQCQRPYPVRECDHRRSARRERLQHLYARQMASVC